jgi:hypothetical protein
MRLALLALWRSLRSPLQPDSPFEGLHGAERARIVSAKVKTSSLERLLSIFAIVAWCGLPWFLVKPGHVGLKLLWMFINLFVGLAFYFARPRTDQSS